MVDIIECNGMFVVTVFGLPYESYETYAEARDGKGSAECDFAFGAIPEEYWEHWEKRKREQI